MAGITEGMMQQLDDTTMRQMGQELGTDPATTNAAVSTALPLLVAALANNSSTPTGASALAGALDRDHDGSALGNLPGLLGAALGGGGAAGGGLGASILNKVLGGAQPGVAQSLGSATGLDSGRAMKLLVMLAPIVLAYLGRQKREQNLDAGGLGSVLSGERDRIQQTRGGSLGPLLGMLDRDGDGSVMDDVSGMMGQVLRR